MVGKEKRFRSQREKKSKGKSRKNESQYKIKNENYTKIQNEGLPSGALEAHSAVGWDASSPDESHSMALSLK